VQLDLVGRSARLTVWEIVHAHAGDQHRNVNGLKAGGDIEHGIRLGSGTGDARIHRTAGRHASRRGNLCDHGIPGGILDDQVIILVAFQLDHRQERIHGPDRCFLRGNTVVGRDRSRCRKRSQIRYGCILWGIEVDLTDIGIGSHFHRLTFHTA
jgi:hypothetical protein